MIFSAFQTSSSWNLRVLAILIFSPPSQCGTLTFIVKPVGHTLNESGSMYAPHGVGVPWLFTWSTGPI